MLLFQSWVSPAGTATTAANSRGIFRVSVRPSLLTSAPAPTIQNWRQESTGYYGWPCFGSQAAYLKDEKGRQMMLEAARTWDSLTET